MQYSTNTRIEHVCQRSRGNLLILTRAFFVNNEIHMAFLLNSQAQDVPGKMTNLPKHHGAGSPEARGPMEQHRLHWLKAGPGSYYTTRNKTSFRTYPL